MAYFRNLPKLQEMMDLFLRDERWLILINADPDAMASAMALKRIMIRRVQEVAIAKVNEVTRPDNLAMIRYTKIRMHDYSPYLLEHYNRFALVDSQPHHHPAFSSIPFSIVIDHHPLPETPPNPLPAYQEIKPEYGATSTLMTEILYALRIHPGKLLATAMQFGIKTDTSSFERHCFDIDLRAYQYLARFADNNLLSRIARSEYHQGWLEFFAKACTHLYPLNKGNYAFIGQVENPDILVVIADFFMRVHELLWVAVAGIYGDQVVIVFRSDGVSRDVGHIASSSFGAIGSAGGHKAMARAEFSLAKAEGKDPELFIWQLLSAGHKKKKGTPKNDTTAEEKGSVSFDNWDDEFLD